MSLKNKSISKLEIQNWISESSELIKMAQPAPTFPHLKLKEDKSSVALVTTPRQQEIGERSIVQHKNLWVNKYNEWAKQHSPETISDKKYSYPKDKDTRTPKGVAFGGPTGRTAMAKPDKPTPIASTRLINKEAYKKGKYHTFFEPNSTVIHETLHDNFGRVFQQYGLPARLNLAHNLYHSLPKQYKYTADSLYALSPTDNSDPHGLKDHWIHEEKLARLGDYLNDRSYRKRMLAYLGSSDPKNHRFDNDVKAAHKAMLHAAKIAHRGWLDNKLYDDNGKFIGKAEYLGDLEELEKSWKSSIIGAGATLAALGSQVKPVAPSIASKPSISQARPLEKPIAKPTEAPKTLVASIPTKQASVAEPAKKTHPAHVFEGLDPDLNFISHLESNHGKYLDHEKNSKGEFHTAFGHLGFKPVSAYEVYSKTKQLKDKYPNLDTNDKFLAIFKSDPKFYNDVASTFWNKMKKRLGSPEKTAFGWRWGLGAALKATQEDIDNDGYTQKYKDMYAHGDIHKSEDFGQTLTHWVQAHIAPSDPLEAKFEDSKDKYDIAQQMVIDKFQDWDEILKVAQFLGGVQEVPEELVNEATEKYPDNPYFAALYACKLPQDKNTKKALIALLSKNESINKSENEAKLPEGKDIKPYCVHGEDIAQVLQKAFQNKTVKHVDLHGKHSKNALLATDQDTGRVYLLKPDDHKLSPALGVADTSANQPVREAVFYHIAKAVGLVNYFPRAEAISIDDGDWAAIKLLPKDFQTINAFCGGDLTKLQDVLRPYLDSGVLYKLAAIDLILGQVDRHSSNGMISKDGRLVLIDQGSGLAGHHFNPGKDKNSYIPFYLRIFTSKDFKKKDHIAKLKELPKLDPKIDKIVKDWINTINPSFIIVVCDEYKINPQPFLERLARLQNWKGLIYTAINRMWCSL